jgi:hypothetical protein
MHLRHGSGGHTQHHGRTVTAHTTTEITSNNTAHSARDGNTALGRNRSGHGWNEADDDQSVVSAAQRARLAHIEAEIEAQALKLSYLKAKKQVSVEMRELMACCDGLELIARLPDAICPHCNCDFDPSTVEMRRGSASSASSCVSSDVSSRRVSSEFGVARALPPLPSPPSPTETPQQHPNEQQPGIWAPPPPPRSTSLTPRLIRRSSAPECLSRRGRFSRSGRRESSPPTIESPPTPSLASPPPPTPPPRRHRANTLDRESLDLIMGGPPTALPRRNSRIKVLS